MNILFRASIAIISLCASITAFAEAADRNKPIELEADSVIVDDAKKISTYIGNVVLTQGTLVIHADKLIVREDRAIIQPKNKQEAPPETPTKAPNPDTSSSTNKLKLSNELTLPKE